MGKLSGKVAIITGAGSGLGRASALAFAAEGARVAAADIVEATVQETAALVAGQGGEAIAMTVDVSRASAVERMVADTVKHFSKLDILFNNAGIDRPEPAHTMSEEAWDLVLNVNLKSVFLGCRYALPELMKHGGAILSTSSIAGLEGLTNHAHYCASKHGIVGLTKSLAIDYAQYNIRVNCINPGGMDTNIAADMTQNMSSEEIEMMLRRSAALHLVNRFAQPGEVAKLAVFLCSDDASFITGASYLVDGGWMAGHRIQ